eukprot:COSAG01_NODE_32427_length_580_cov_4.076763_1_plen_76_part_00
MWFDGVIQELADAVHDHDAAKAKKLLERLQPRARKRSPMGVLPTIDRNKKRLGSLKRTAAYLGTAACVTRTSTTG